jgi:hypothetical protein
MAGCWGGCILAASGRELPLLLEMEETEVLGVGDPIGRPSLFTRLLFFSCSAFCPTTSW